MNDSPPKNWAQDPDINLLKDWAQHSVSISTLKQEMNYGPPKNWAQGPDKYLLKDWAHDIQSIATLKHEMNYINGHVKKNSCQASKW